MRMHEDARQTLTRLLEIVEARLKSLPSWEDRPARRKAVETLELDLEEHGARFGSVSGGYTVSLAGVRASSTMATESALQNWCAGARKRLGGAS